MQTNESNPARNTDTLNLLHCLVELERELELELNDLKRNWNLKQLELNPQRCVTHYFVFCCCCFCINNNNNYYYMSSFSFDDVSVVISAAYFYSTKRHTCITFFYVLKLYLYIFILADALTRGQEY